MRPFWLAATLALGAACHDGAVFVDLPEGGPAGAVVFVVETGDATPYAFVSARGRPQPLEFELAPGAAARLYAVQYAAGLERLGLVPGPVDLAAAEDCGARSLPAQDALHAMMLGEGQDGEWEPLAARPAVVDAVRVPGPCPCRRFETVDTVDLPMAAGWFSDDEGALLLDADGRFSRLDRDARITPIPEAVTAPVLGLTAGLRARGGRIWLGVGRALWQGGLTEPFTVTASLTQAMDKFSYFAGGEVDGRQEVFASTRSGALLRIEPGPVEVVQVAMRLLVNPDQQGRIVWLGPGRVVASEQFSSDIFWMDDGVETDRLTLPADAGGVRLLFRVAGRLFAVTSLSEWYRLDGRELENLGGPRLRAPSSVLRFEDSFVTSGDSGVLQEYRLDHGFCPTQTLASAPRVIGLVPLGDRFLAITRQSGVMTPRGLLLVPRPWSDDT